MTELLYLLSVTDPRVRPLLTGVKQWAKSHQLTSGGQQTKVTTLGLITLLVYFLQTRSPPVLPTLWQLQDLSDPHAEKFTIDDVTYGLPRSPKLVPKSKNTESIGERYCLLFLHRGEVHLHLEN